ncbi:MAG: T9SS type A sorting domain-containing protein [Arachidicoccus sp.]|nr:T9SS type A sorting domain-containing protein [Arachidicoccus sp.]
MKRAITFFISIVLLNAAQAQYIQKDSTLTSKGTYSGLGWPPGVTVTVPAGQTINASIGYGGGKLKVYGNLILSQSAQLNDSLIISGSSAEMSVNGTLTTNGTILVEDDAQLEANNINTNAQNKDSVLVKSGASFTVNQNANINTGHLKILDNATFTVNNNLDLKNSNNYFGGTIIVGNTMIFSTGPNEMECPAQIFVNNLTNNAASTAIDGSGYINVTGTFTGINALTNSSGIVINYSSGKGNPGSANTFSTVSPCSTTLPVTINYFNVNYANKNTVITWETKSEINNKGFSVQTSTNGKTFNEIAFVSSIAENGNSNQPLSYQYSDNNPLSGTIYYRIIQINKDGVAGYISPVKEVTVNNILSSIKIYPNPSSDFINISGITANNPTFRILNENGQIVLTSASYKIPVFSLSKGIYFIQLIDSNNTKTIGKFIKL